MVLGRLVGVAIASSVISKNVANAAVTIMEKRPPTQKNTYIYNNTNTCNSYNNSQSYYQSVSYVNCDYCGGVNELRYGVTTCCNCGAPLRVKQQAQQAPNNSGSNYYAPGYQRQQSLWYSFPCYRCAATVRYTSTDVFRSPISNQAVIDAGFHGHTGEIRCGRCGAYLPHFETYLENGW